MVTPLTHSHTMQGNSKAEQCYRHPYFVFLTSGVHNSGRTIHYHCHLDKYWNDRAQGLT